MEYNKLKGKNLVSVGRCADMPVLGFGDTFTLNRRGKQRKYPEYEFHIQCPFRIMKENQIIFRLLIKVLMWELHCYHYCYKLNKKL